jgi:hypothetical protein
MLSILRAHRSIFRIPAQAISASIWIKPGGLDSRDQLLKLLEIILTVKTFQLRLSCVKIFEICQDFSSFMDISQHY